MDDFVVIPTLLADKNSLQLSFAEIEANMKQNHLLPELAKTYSAWWTKKEHSYSSAWTAYGYQVDTVDLVNQRVFFSKK
ncbi:hypothetical protein UAY_01933 [Enterococcus moraviensis ATCC BAA-383]|uniref:DUF7662 domain-containing protein n=1 Tax=Enterococcus moraviensis ATCC BAA-383 TaxID=1158609 RepID=R2T287_9ENTE|nr:hypothetical protein [Enterococcus moraviensis]EOH99156.1 hypothetical protein UAY_01933 [Enterococcus moraviensis ATCC BAA-383]EOT72161.1 hypothetical protein I586_01969 [Enterococcus moraviensis ATCC BAA-383]OJG67407.1 hypothetical protein RV09_GL002623 [Enterococcus moraviensis]